ncbi:hypothetical protein POM88_037336 [Heracleum sosnowskyi]|uniref:Reverse transcriptase zinc-binding domain-containing protein n=1 Tax=Heracleum sosnowskyi TaxID=360622 RepID=A0AAD8HPZ8_9APIA|nr:hypothetical protein POM88_037336 [Heracleum sosnowskyi]
MRLGLRNFILLFGRRFVNRRTKVDWVLLAKWWSRWLKERDEGWAKKFRTKYACSKGDDFNSIKEKDCSNVMKGILSINEDNGFRQSLLRENFKLNSKNGNSSLFWEDLWFGNVRLSVIFSRLYNISKHKFLTVRAVCEMWWLSGQRMENLWTRPLRAWELEEALKINDVISAINFKVGGDILIWIRSGTPYTTNIGKEFLESNHLASFTGWNLIWKIKAPPKLGKLVKVFLTGGVSNLVWQHNLWTISGPGKGGLKILMSKLHGMYQLFLASRQFGFAGTI